MKFPKSSKPHCKDITKKTHSATLRDSINDIVNAYLIKTLKSFCRQNFHDVNSKKAAPEDLSSTRNL